MAKRLTIAIVGVLFIGTMANAASTILRVECRKDGSGGCTADYEDCYSAPDGKFIRDGSISAGSAEKFWLKQPRCGAARISSRVSVILQNGSPDRLATGFCANLHVESGSGMMNLGQVAFVDCRYDFQLGDIPQ